MVIPIKERREFAQLGLGVDRFTSFPVVGILNNEEVQLVSPQNMECLWDQLSFGLVCCFPKQLFVSKVFLVGGLGYCGGGTVKCHRKLNSPWATKMGELGKPQSIRIGTNLTKIYTLFIQKRKQVHVLFSKCLDTLLLHNSESTSNVLDRKIFTISGRRSISYNLTSAHWPALKLEVRSRTYHLAIV